MTLPAEPRVASSADLGLRRREGHCRRAGLLLAAVAAVISLGGVPARQAVALEPCGPDVGGYRQFLLAELTRRTPGRIVAAFIAMPSFTPEYGVLLSEVAGRMAVYRLSFDRSVWNASVVESAPGTFTHRFTRAIAPGKSRHAALARDLATRLQALLAAELSSPKPSAAGGLDGETYQFTVGAQCAQTWSPQARTREDFLVRRFEEAGALVALSGHQRDVAERDLRGKLDAYRAAPQ